MGDVPAFGKNLLAAWKQIGSACMEPSAAYVACKEKSQEPSACRAEGMALMECVQKTLNAVSGKCPDEFGAYAACLDYNGMKFEKCRAEQESFEGA